MGKAVAPLYISRLNLYNTLSKQYGGRNPFVMQKDGKDTYSFKNDIVAFTCCNKSDHVNRMSPLQMLQLVYIYGPYNPCPICNKIGIKVNKKSLSELGGQEEGSDMEYRKKYLETDDPSENAVRESLLEAELNNTHVKEETYHTKKEEVVAESVDYDEYIKEHPEFENKAEEVEYGPQPAPNNDEYDIIEAEYEDDDIVDSVPYEEYVVNNPNYDNKIIGDERFNKKPINKYDADYLFDNGQEDGSMFAFNEDEQNERSVQSLNSDHIKEEHPGHTNIIKNNVVSEINEDLTREIEEEYESEELETDDITDYESSVDESPEIEKSNVEDTNILYNESNASSENLSDSDLDDEEDFEIRGV